MLDENEFLSPYGIRSLSKIHEKEPFYMEVCLCRPGVSCTGDIILLNLFRLEVLVTASAMCPERVILSFLGVTATGGDQYGCVVSSSRQTPCFVLWLLNLAASPVNFLIIECLERYYYFYGDDLKMDYPTGSGNKVNLLYISQDLCRRVANLFLPDENGRRPCHGDTEMYYSDPYWKDLVLFYEYFDGDTGRGCGARYK